MAYSNIYKLTGHDRLNSLMEASIQKKDYAGSVSKMILDGKNPIDKKYNLEKRVYGTGVIINILNDFDDKFLFAKMLADPYETYKLKVEVAGNIHFEGFLLPQTFNQDVRYKSYVALTFGNGLRMLENITPSFLTTGVDVYVSEMDILINIFSYLNLDYTIYINSTLYEDSMSAPEKADNPLKAIDINRLVFQKNDGDWDDALTILNKILISINADCYIRGERIMIERFVDKANNPKTFWTYNPITETHSSTEEAFTEKTLDHIVLAAKSFRYQVDPPVKTLELKLNAKKFVNILDNDFDRKVEHGAAPFELHYWTYNVYTNIIQTDFSNLFIARGINITRHGIHSWAQYSQNAFLIYKGELTNKDDLVILNLSFKASKAVSAGDNIDFRYRVRLISQADGTMRHINASGGVQVAIYTFHDIQTNSESSGYRYEFEIKNTFDLSGLLNAEGLDGDLFVEVEVRPPDMDQDQVDVIYGDFLLSQEGNRINNMLEVALNNDAFKVIKEELDLYDTGFINNSAQKVLSDASGHKITDSWTDGINTSKSLQRHYILNKCNLYNSSCPILNLTILDETVDINIDDIFVFNNLKDDLGNSMKFYITGYDFNVKYHIYNLVLKQWLTDVGKDIV